MRQIQVRKSYEKEGFKEPVFGYRPDWPYISIGFGDEREYFVENLSLLISSGMGMLNALEAMSASMKTRKMKKIVRMIEVMVNEGSPLWRALEETGILPEREISLVRAGEEAGRLPEHLNLVTLQRHKDKVFKSRLRSALIYPGIVLFLAFLVAVGGAWLILPKLVAIFSESNGTLPVATRLLLSVGTFFGRYGTLAALGSVALVLFLAYAAFINRKTRFIGDAILFTFPVIKKLARGVEMARFGYVLGALLQAGFQVNDALSSVIKGTRYDSYRKFYGYLRECVSNGETFKSAFSNSKKTDRFIPRPIQQLIVSSESSGKLPETLIKIGVIFEEKTDAMSQDLSTVLEPIVLIIVGLVVGFVVLAIIGPIYDLSNQL